MSENKIGTFKHGKGGYTNHGCRCSVCRAGQKAYGQDWRKRNILVVKEKDRVRNEIRSGELKEYLRGYYQDNKKKISSRTKEWCRNNLERLHATKNRYDRERCRTDPSYRLAKRLRCRVLKALKGCHKSERTVELLGCQVKQLQLHLEAMFQPGMSWGNYGEWHVDHIIPCASFDLSQPDEQKKCFHFTNLQPLWAIDNLRKNKYVKPYLADVLKAMQMLGK